MLLRISFSILVLLFLISGCKVKSSLTNQDLNCNCTVNKIVTVDNYAPQTTYVFSNNYSVSICGEKENDFISEFSILDCKSNKIIEGYNDGTQQYKIEFESDTLKMVAFKFLPIGSNWEFEDTPIYFDYITINNKVLTSLETKIIFKGPKIEQSIQTDFIDAIYLIKENGFQEDWDLEEIISRLEVLALIGNDKAKQTLYELEYIINSKFDGGGLEHYKDAISNIELLMN